MPNACRNRTDASSICTDMCSVETDMKTAENALKNVRTGPNDSKTRNSPAGSATSHSEDPNTFRNHTDMHSAETDAHAAANDAKDVRKGQNCSKPQNSLKSPENGMPKSTRRRRIVSIDDINIYVPWNTPVEVPGRMFAFGRFEGGDQGMAVRNVEQRAGDSDGGRNRGDGSMDGTTSGGSIDLIQVKAVLLATESQYMRYSQRKRNGGSPVSSEPPTYPAERPYRPVKHRRRRHRIKFEPIKVNPMQNSKTAYLGHDPIVQSRGDDLQSFI